MEVKPKSTVQKNSDMASGIRELSVYVITWNVGSRYPDNISLTNLLQLHDADKTHLPDIYAIGLQEVNSQPQNQVLGLFKEDQWVTKLKEATAEHDFVVAKTEQMQGLLLTILVKREHLLQLRDVEAEFTRTGLGGVWGNKGAVSIRLNMYGCGLAFVVSHLAAHDHKLDERIEDYQQILENHHYHVKNYREIFDHDYVFWFGDLNFRLHGEDPPEEVRDAIYRDKLPQLMERDQLLHVRNRTGEAFHLMEERVPGFPPTFKFKEGTSTYDMKRRPAWTDRIMFATQPLSKKAHLPSKVRQLSYKSHPGYNISDHKPVSSDFTIQVINNFKVSCIDFRDIILWNIGEENTVEYTKPEDFEEWDHDWIGIFRSNFASLSNYKAYEYVNQAETPPTPPENDEYFEHHHRRNRPRLQRNVTENRETVRIEFCDEINLKHGKEYLLIYFQNTGIRGVTSVVGMSRVFRAEKRPSTP